MLKRVSTVAEKTKFYLLNLFFLTMKRLCLWSFCDFQSDNHGAYGLFKLKIQFLILTSRILSVETAT